MNVAPSEFLLRKVYVDCLLLTSLCIMTRLNSKYSCYKMHIYLNVLMLCNVLYLVLDKKNKFYLNDVCFYDGFKST